MSDLKPCPFCGGEASIDRMGNSRVSMQISCNECGCHFESGETWIDENSSWNKRVTDRLEQENAELREAIEAAMRIKDLWLPFHIVANEHEGEAIPLHRMYNKFEQLLNK